MYSAHYLPWVIFGINLPLLLVATVIVFALGGITAVVRRIAAALLWRLPRAARLAVVLLALAAGGTWAWHRFSHRIAVKLPTGFRLHHVQGQAPLSTRIIHESHKGPVRRLRHLPGRPVPGHHGRPDPE
jgi:hypothetical protein